jgi:hypothetical protein
VSGVDQILKGLQDTVTGNVHKQIESNSHYDTKNESTLPLWLLAVSRKFLYSLTLQMETCSTETWVYFQRAAQDCISVDRTFYDQYCENFQILAVKSG